MKNRSLLAAFLVLATVLVAAPAPAAFHVMRIVQVYGGDATHPDAQYVVLQMCLANQNQVGGHSVGFFDAADVAIGTPTVFPGPVSNGASQARIFVATSSAEALFGVTADLRIPARILPPGGKLCFEPGDDIDCFAWGNFSDLPDTTVGTPYDAGVGLPAGSAVQRDLSLVGGSSTLECTSPTDDTDNSAGDFDPTIPNPGNNGGATGIIDADHIFLHAFEAGTSAGWVIVP